MYFDRARKDGGNQVEKMNEVTKEFNEVLEKVFPGYALEAKWNSVNGSPEIKLKIKSLLPLSLENLSLGQQEVLSLIFNIYTSTEFNHVYLIDEPEIHLNWNLEKGLFEFFEWFCTTYNKQIIVVTHSRVIFKPEFYAKCQFLVWENNKLIVKESATDAQKETIAGELAATINLIAPTSKTFFVEDNMHETVIRAISKNIGKTVSVVQCINSPNVKSFYNLSKEKSSAWKENGYYVIDGDNEGNPYPGEDRFIQLTKYSIDSYIFDIDLLAKLLNKPIADIQTSILALIKRKKGAIFSKGKSAKFGEALLEKLTHDYITTENLGLLDCSAIIEEFAKEFGFRTPQLMIDDFVKLAYDDSILDKIFEKKLVDAISA
jgi:energy-coupling factor transporter ATP-binding protein EcfA2